MPRTAHQKPWRPVDNGTVSFKAPNVLSSWLLWPLHPVSLLVLLVSFPYMLVCFALTWTSSPGRGPPLSQLSDYARPENPQMCTLVPFPEFGSMDPCLFHVPTSNGALHIPNMTFFQGSHLKEPSSQPPGGPNPNSACQKTPSLYPCTTEASVAWPTWLFTR